jgi:hypothetical protein
LYLFYIFDLVLFYMMNHFLESKNK